MMVSHVEAAAETKSADNASATRRMQQCQKFRTILMVLDNYIRHTKGVDDADAEHCPYGYKDTCPTSVRGVTQLLDFHVIIPIEKIVDWNDATKTPAARSYPFSCPTKL